jgi:outer membrane receptor for ferrienterochelin and colicins
MAVPFGENAVTGIINIITKNSSNYKWEISVTAQEETVGDEYAFFDEGRHIQSFKVANNITENIFASLNFSRNDFKGFLNNRKGESYNQSDLQRGYDWLPKEQYSAKALIRYKKENFNIFYRLEYFNEEINFFNPVVEQNIHPPTQIANPFSFDRNFYSNRISHQLSSNGKINKLNYQVFISYQEQIKDVDIFQYFINTKNEANNEETEYLSNKVFHSKGTLSNFISEKKYDFQLGYELSSQKGFGSSVTGLFDGNDIESKLDNYDFFTSAEFNISDSFSLRPGARVSFQSDFDTQFAGSLSTKYNFGNGYSIRNIIGTSYRTPNFEELFTFFVDSNHDVQGNENLIPEKSYSVFTNVKKDTWFENGSKLTNSIKINFLDVSEKITLAIVDTDVTPIKFQFINIDEYKYLGFSSNNTLQIDNIKFQFGVSVSGISQILDSETGADDDFLYSLEVNTKVSYEIPKWKTSFSLSYKFTGEQSEFVQRVDSNGDTVFDKGTRESFSWMDASVQKRFLDNKIKTTFGVRNIFDVTEIETTAVAGGTQGDPRNITFGYGRSFLLKISYNLNL